ncbi:MAG: rod shape-determining protein MreC [Patescibacteria group bacterium]|nr:rod shape-determining protein MreC [Patescibacteria group bacterium]
MAKVSLRKISIFVAVILLLIFLHFIKILSPVENAVIFVLNPFARQLHSLSSSWRSSYEEKTKNKDLVNEVFLLEKKINELSVENAQLKALEEENKILRGYLQFLKEKEFKYVLADVVSSSFFSNPEENEKKITINKGSKAGLSPGLALINSEGMIIGKISEVKDYISLAYLSTDSNCRLAATIQGETETEGVTEGDLGLTIKMNFVPQAKGIKLDDSVVTSGLEKNIPAGLLIGKVTQVEKENNEIWQKAIIEPMVDIDSISVVSVLMP